MSLLRNADYLLGPYRGKNFPPLPCPSCGHPLTIKSDAITSVEAGWSARSIEVAAIGQEDREGYFTLIATCDRESCHEQVVITGEDSIDIIDYPEGGSGYETLYTIKFMLPTIELFPVSDDCTNLVRKHLMSSFALFWSNPSSAGNSLRCALEALMDQKKIPKSRRRANGGRLVSLSLDARIKKFRDQSQANKKIADHLLAIKWVGNAGSHKANLTREDLIKAYELTEHAFDEIYEKRSQRLQMLAKQVINNKGPK